MYLLSNSFQSQRYNSFQQTSRNIGDVLLNYRQITFLLDPGGSWKGPMK